MKSFKLWEVSKRLAAVAMGREAAELVIKGGRLVNVLTGELENNIDVAVVCGRIALVGDAEHTIGEGTTVIDAQGMYLTPAFIDGHLHVESSMMTVCEYAKTALPHGTGTIMMDPHEIVNVMGLDGMKAMMADGEASQMRVYTTTPSCVPACPGFEDTGGVITPDDIKETMEWDNVCGLGEMMNYPGIIGGDDNTHEIVAQTLRARKTVTGHFPFSNTGAALNAYIASGANCCHESTHADEVIAKMRRGMYAMIREGSAWHDLTACIRAITERNIDTRFAVLVSDDLHADTLLNKGHMDYIVSRAISEGVNPITAIQMATINTAQCFKLDGEIGAIAPGRFADINILSDLSKVKIEKVIINGKDVAECGCLLNKTDDYIYPEQFRASVKISRQIKASDFSVKAPDGAQTVDVKTIEVHEASSLTTKTIRRLPVEGGLIDSIPAMDILKVAVIDRHHENGSMSVGFVKGFNLKKGAVASTYAHDAHNLLVVGVNEEDMAFAANKLIECGGGMIAVEDGKVLTLLELPIAGLISDEPAIDVAKALRGLEAAWLELGSPIVSPFMTMSLLSLAVIPEIRITNRGIVDVTHMKLTSLID